MVKAWLMDNETTDQRLEHHRNPPVYINLEELFTKTGVEHFLVGTSWVFFLIVITTTYLERG